MQLQLHKFKKSFSIRLPYVICNLYWIFELLYILINPNVPPNELITFQPLEGKISFCTHLLSVFAALLVYLVHHSILHTRYIVISSVCFGLPYTHDLVVFSFESFCFCLHPSHVCFREASIVIGDDDLCCWHVQNPIKVQVKSEFYLEALLLEQVGCH